MESETPNPASPAKAEATTPQAVTQVPPETSTPKAKTLLSQAGQCAVFAVFGLYLIGFLIWHAYLDTFSVSSLEFLKVEYFSAALCYILFTVSISFAPALLFDRLYAKFHPLQATTSAPSMTTEAINLVAFVWYWIYLMLPSLLFPRSQRIDQPLIHLLYYIAAGVMFLYVGLLAWTDFRATVRQQPSAVI
jgi:hypothetical protein